MLGDWPPDSQRSTRTPGAKASTRKLDREQFRSYFYLLKDWFLRYFCFLACFILVLSCREMFIQLGSLPYFCSALKPKYSPPPSPESAVINYTVKTQLPFLCWKQSAISTTQCYSHALLQCQKLKPILGWEWACRGKRGSLQHTVPPCQSNWGQAGSTQARGSLGLHMPLEIENKMLQPLVSCH